LIWYEIKSVVIMNEVQNKLKLNANDSKATGEDGGRPLLTWDDYSPSWERKFIAGVESMRTIPHVSLMCFSFIKVTFGDAHKTDVVSGLSQATPTASTSTIDSNSGSSSPCNPKTVDKDSTHESLTELRSLSGSSSGINSSRPARGKESSFHRTKKRMNRLLRAKRTLNKRDLSRTEVETIKTTESKRTNPDSPRSLPMLLNPNDSVQVALQLFRLNNPLYDYNEIQRKRRLKKMNQILDKDDGPFYTNYRYVL
jgi:hypothetical protein